MNPRGLMMIFFRIMIGFVFVFLGVSIWMGLNWSDLLVLFRKETRFYDYGSGFINISKVTNITHTISINALSQNPKCQLSASGALHESTYSEVREVARQAIISGCGPAANINASIKFDNFTLTLTPYEGASSVEEAIKSYQASRTKIF